jgi:hypothetical protein
MRLRLSRTAWLVLGIGVLVIALGSLYTVYSRQVSEQQELEASLAAAQARWPQVISARQAAEAELTQWQDKLAEATSLLAKSEAKFPESAESIKYDELLFDIADVCDLEVMSLTASEPSDKKEKVEVEDIEVEDVTYIVTSFEIEVQAAGLKPGTVAKFETYIDETVANILDFIDTVAKDENFTNATIESVDMKNLKPPSEDELEGAPKPSATIKITIYSYKGE